MRHGAILGMIRRSGLLLALLALLAGAGVPRGWMPQAQAAGITVSLCSAGLDGAAHQQALAAANVLLANALSDPDEGAREPSPEGRCPFAAAPLPVLPPAAGLPVITPERAVHDLPMPAAVAIGRGLAAPPPPATGPPLHH